MLGSLHRQSDCPNWWAMRKVCTFMQPGFGALYLVSQDCTGNLMINPLQLSVEEACTKCRHPWMREALQMWLEQRGWSSRQHCSSLEPQTNGVPVAS